MSGYGKAFKEALKGDKPVIGGHIFLPNPSMAEAMARFGYGYIWVDGEHGAFDKQDILAHIMAINGAGAGAIVRVTSSDPAVIKPVLEMGPDGIIVPMVCSAEEAEGVISACTYPPRGTRGFGPRRANGYGTVSNQEYLDTIDGDLVKIMQIEHRDAVDRIDDILSVEGIDAIVIGPNDLSGSLGLLTQITHPEVLARCETIIAACRTRNIPWGVSIGPKDRDYISYWLDRRVDFIFCGDELSFVRAGTGDVISFIENH